MSICTSCSKDNLGELSINDKIHIMSRTMPNDSNLRVIVYPLHPYGGALEVYEDMDPELITERQTQIVDVADCIGNEPLKDFSFFLRFKKKEINDSLIKIKENGIDSVAAIRALKHPLLENKFLILNGHHRLGTFRIGKIPQIRILLLQKQDIFLSRDLELRNPKTFTLNTNPNVINLADADANEFSKYFNVVDNSSAWPIDTWPKE